MKRFMLAVLTLAMLSVALVACGSKPQAQVQPAPEVTKLVVPEKWLQIERYPVIARKHVMTDAELEQLGLRRDTLKMPTLFFNHYRELGRNKKGGWRHEILPAGTMVAVDKNGRSWYKIDCSNRLYAPVERERSTAPQAGSDKGKSDGSGKSNDGWSPWWLLLPLTAVGGMMWWLWWGSKDEGGGDPDANDPMAWARTPKADAVTGGAATATDVAAAAGTTAAAAGGADTNAPTPLIDRMERVERDVAGIRESLVGLEDRVVTRLEPTIAAAVDNGGKARAKTALYEHLNRKLDEGNVEMVEALTEMMKALD